MKKIWLVMGSSGSYSDYREWPVKAFTTEERAKEFSESLPKIWADLSQPTDADKVQADENLRQTMDHWKNIGRAFAGCKPNVEFVARSRAWTTMREQYDPSFGGAPGHSPRHGHWHMAWNANW